MLSQNNLLKILLKEDKQIFDRNYTMAKRVQALSEQGKFDEAIKSNDQNERRL
jgi:hypothetical protein